MKWLKTELTLLMLAIWLPASSHALLEHYGIIHHSHAHDHGDSDHDSDSEGPHEHDTDNHPAADGLCLFSSTKVKPKPVAFTVVLWLEVTWIDAGPRPEFRAHAAPSPPGVAPPELSHCWQFSFRAALPVRAPSLVS